MRHCNVSVLLLQPTVLVMLQVADFATFLYDACMQCLNKIYMFILTELKCLLEIERKRNPVASCMTRVSTNRKTICI